MLVAISNYSIYRNQWEDSLNSLGISTKQVNFLNISKEEIQKYSGLIWHVEGSNKSIRSTAFAYLNSISHLNINTFPNANSSKLFDNKIAQHLFFSNLSLPIPKGNIFLDEGQALDWIQNTNLPVVYKSASGAGSSGVKLINSVDIGTKLVIKAFRKGLYPSLPIGISMPHFRIFLRHLLAHSGLINTASVNDFVSKHGTLKYSPVLTEKGHIFFQEFIPNNKFDFRITIIGDKAFGMRRFNRKNDFRASGSNNNDLDHTAIPLNIISFAFDVSKKLDMHQAMAADIIIGQNGEPLLIEVSYTFGNVFQPYPGYWTGNCEWIPQNISRFQALVQNFVSSLC